MLGANIAGASCQAPGGEEAAEGFRVKRQSDCMNISSGSNVRPRNIWWSLQGAGPAQKAGTVKFGRQRGRKELGGRWDANLPACLLIRRHCRARDERAGGYTAFPHPEGPQPCCVLPLSTSVKTCPTWGSQPPYTYPPGQAIATLDGRVPREFHTGDRIIVSIDRGDTHTGILLTLAWS